MRTLTRAPVSHDPPTGVDGFVFVSREEMTMAERIYTDHSIMQGAFEITAGTLLSGGIVLQHPILPRGDVDRAWYSETWGEFIREMLRNFWLYGFAICTADPDDVYAIVPRVVPMDIARVEIRYGLTGKRTYRITHAREMNVSLETMPSLNRVMENAWVYEVDPPTVSGGLRSKIYSLRHDADFVEAVNRTYASAIHRRATIPLVLQSQQDTYDSKNVRVAESEPFLGSMHPVVRGPEEAQTIAEERVAHIARLRNAGLDPNQALGMDVRTTKTSTGQDVIHLPRDRQLVNPTICDAPNAVIDVRMDFMMRVGVVLQVPIAAMFGKQHGSTLAQSAGERSVAVELFTKQQQRYKHMFIAIMRDVFIEAYAIQLAAMAVATDEPESSGSTIMDTDGKETQDNPKPSKRKVETDKVVDKLSVSMPGQPSMEDAIRMYGLGLITWDALRMYVGVAQFIPEAMLNKAPKLDDVQMAAVSVGTAPRDVPAPAAAPPKKKAKK